MKRGGCGWGEMGDYGQGQTIWVVSQETLTSLCREAPSLATTTTLLCPIKVLSIQTGPISGQEWWLSVLLWGGTVRQQVKKGNMMHLWQGGWGLGNRLFCRDRFISAPLSCQMKLINLTWPPLHVYFCNKIKAMNLKTDCVIFSHQFTNSGCCCCFILNNVFSETHFS